LVIVEVHAPGRVKELLHRTGRNTEAAGQEPREILAVEGRREREHRVIEADVLELHDRIGDLGRPEAPTALDHAVRKPVQ
jgi:hypothetical protein